jgi:hypothetical protein
MQLSYPSLPDQKKRLDSHFRSAIKTDGERSNKWIIINNMRNFMRLALIQTGVLIFSILLLYL